MFGIKSEAQVALEEKIASRISNQDFKDHEGHKLADELEGAARNKGKYALENAIEKFAAALVGAVGMEAAEKTLGAMSNIDVSDAIEEALAQREITIHAGSGVRK